MLGNDVLSFSICVSHGPDTRNSLLPSASAMDLLKSATSRVVIPSFVRICFNRSPGSMGPPPSGDQRAKSNGRDPRITANLRLFSIDARAGLLRPDFARPLDSLGGLRD